jgi:hypothetical protein
VIWSTGRRDASPQSVANEFAASFPDDRKADVVRGDWKTSRKGQTWEGTFQLVDGVKTYALTFENGMWFVREQGNG